MSLPCDLSRSLLVNYCDPESGDNYVIRADVGHTNDLSSHSDMISTYVIVCLKNNVLSFISSFRLFLVSILSVCLFSLN